MLLSNPSSRTAMSCELGACLNSQARSVAYNTNTKRHRGETPHSVGSLGGRHVLAHRGRAVQSSFSQELIGRKVKHCFPCWRFFGQTSISQRRVQRQQLGSPIRIAQGSQGQLLQELLPRRSEGLSLPLFLERRTGDLADQRTIVPLLDFA